MMRALNNPWNPRGRKTATPVEAKIAPLVYLSESGTPVEGQPTKEEGNEKSVGIDMSSLDKTELVPDNSRRGERFESKELSPERHLMIRKIRTSLKMGVQRINPGGSGDPDGNSVMHGISEG